MRIGAVMETIACLEPCPAVAGTGDTPVGRRAAVVADERAFRALVNEHRSRLQSFIERNIGRSSDAEELTQQAFVEAARSIVSFRGESALSTWLYGIAMNLVRNYLSRAPHRRYAFEDDSALESIASEGANPEQQAERRELLAKLSGELEMLPAEMRQVLMLVAVEELSYEEAAVMLSIPIGTVRSRASRARTMLRGRFEREGVTEPF
jgi:RNA polymerase sigma-70 factor (ECF subfamily)